MSEHRAYTTGQLLDLLNIPRSTFYELRRRGDLPMLDELKPRLGRSARYRADLVDRYLAGQWHGPRAFRRMASIVAVLALAASACGVSKSNILAPSAPITVALREVSYDINIPFRDVANSLKATYPNGIRMAPFEAQRQFDFTAAYKGSPNVYYGEVAPHCEYPGVGIVVAPLHVASLAEFISSDWPGLFEPGFTYIWVGRFVYTAAAAPGTYVIDPNATCSTPRLS